MSRGSVKKDKSGKWMLVADIAPIGARRRRQIRRRGFRTQREAQAALAELQGQTARGDFVEPRKITVAEWFARWIESLDVRPATIKSYRNTLRLHVTPDIGDGRLQALTPVDIDRVYARLRDEGRLSRTSIRFVHTVVHGALAAAVSKGLLRVNPADAASRPSSGRPPEMKTWNPAEMRAFLEHGLVRSDRLFAFWRLVCTTGLRRGEALGLKWSDLEGDRIRVQRQVVNDNGTPRETDTKTPGSHRAVALDPETVAVLRAHRRRQLEERLEFGVRSKVGYIFSELDGGPILPSRVTRRFAQLVRDTGSKQIRLHDVRHSHAVNLLEAGVNSKAVAARLGHSSVSFSLDRYGHATPEGDEAAARAAAARVDGGDQ